MPRMPREEAESYLANVPDEYVFWCHDGVVLRNLRDLKGALGTMSDETFAYHSNSEKSDFSNWVNDVIGDEKLARDLKKSPDRSLAARTVSQRIAFLESRL